MQLYALLESIDHFVDGVDSISIICRADDFRHKRAYRIVAKDFSHLKPKFIFQGKTPKEDFRKITLEEVRYSDADFLLFSTDDIIVTDPINLHSCEEALHRNRKALGFFLRLGKNIHKCFSNNSFYTKNFSLPPLTLSEGMEDVFQWQFMREREKWPYAPDWNYPNNVDMTLYRKRHISFLLRRNQYTSPNTLEGAIAKEFLPLFYGLCFSKSKIVNIPANLVQQDWINPTCGSFSPEKLLKLFFEGYKIDITPLQGVENKAPHHPYKYTFVKR